MSGFPVFFLCHSKCFILFTSRWRTGTSRQQKQHPSRQLQARFNDQQYHLNQKIKLCSNVNGGHKSSVLQNIYVSRLFVLPCCSQCYVSFALIRSFTRSRTRLDVHVSSLTQTVFDSVLGWGHPHTMIKCTFGFDRPEDLKVQGCNSVAVYVVPSCDVTAFWEDSLNQNSLHEDAQRRSVVALSTSQVSEFCSGPVLPSTVRLIWWAQITAGDLPALPCNFSSARMHRTEIYKLDDLHVDICDLVGAWDVKSILRKFRAFCRWCSLWCQFFVRF